jgi:ATP-dependent Lon protease
LPLLPLRDVVVFPHMVIPLFVGRPKSIKALEAAMEVGKSIMLVAQKNASKDDPVAADIYEIGCVSNILQMLKLPDGTVKVLVEGVQRATTHAIRDEGEHFVGDVTPVAPPGEGSPEIEALRRAVTQQFDQYVKLNKKIPPEILTSIAGIGDPGRLADTIAAVIGAGAVGINLEDGGRDPDLHGLLPEPQEPCQREVREGVQGQVRCEPRDR